MYVLSMCVCMHVNCVHLALKWNEQVRVDFKLFQRRGREGERERVCMWAKLVRDSDIEREKRKKENAILLSFAFSLINGCHDNSTRWTHYYTNFSTVYLYPYFHLMLMHEILCNHLRRVWKIKLTKIMGKNDTKIFYLLVYVLWSSCCNSNSLNDAKLLCISKWFDRLN